MPIHLGSDEQRPSGRPAPQRQATRLVWADRAGGGSDAGTCGTAAKLEGGEPVDRRGEQFTTNWGTEISGRVTITAVTASEPAKEISIMIVPPAPGDQAAQLYRKMAGTPPTPAHSPSRIAGSRNRACWARGDGSELPPHPRRGRIGVAAMGSGWPRALDEAISYAKERLALREPISKFQTIQRKIADLCADRGGRRHRRWPRWRRTWLLVHADRGPGEAHHRRPCGACDRGGGTDPCGDGYIEEYPVRRFYRDAKT